MLDFDGISYWAVLVAWLINIVVGALWYSPMLFGKTWSKLSGVDIMKIPVNEANKILTFVALSGLVQAIVLAIVLNTFDVTTATNGFVAGLVLWLGFVAATTVGTTLYSRKSWKFWWLNSSYFLIVMCVNSVILAVWN
jgi:hypothetical protein